MRVEIRRKAFGETVVLKDFALALEPREAVAILGPSGVGKTTLIRIIAGLDTRYEGSVTEAGRVAYVFQEPTLLPWRTIGQNLTIAAGADAGAVEEALESVGLGGFAPRFPSTLSLGQARRASLARAFLTTPNTLLLDEPFASLDPDAVERMASLLEAFRARLNMRLLLVSHEEVLARRLCDRVVRLG